MEKELTEIIHSILLSFPKALDIEINVTLNPEDLHKFQNRLFEEYGKHVTIINVNPKTGNPFTPEESRITSLRFAFPVSTLINLKDATETQSKITELNKL
jgi:hypothetical protein